LDESDISGLLYSLVIVLVFDDGRMPAAIARFLGFLFGCDRSLAALAAALSFAPRFI
jgi:hypothetical protein